LFQKFLTIIQDKFMDVYEFRGSIILKYNTSIVDMVQADYSHSSFDRRTRTNDL